MNRHAQRGETLIEVVIAAAIMAMAAASSMSIANAAFKTGVQSRERTEAIYAVQDQAEKLVHYRNTLMESGVAGTMFTSGNFPCSSSCRMSADGRQFLGGTQTYNGRYVVSITRQAEPSGSPYAQRFTVRAAWNDVKNHASSSEVRLLLVDKRGGSLTDCGVVGC